MMVPATIAVAFRRVNERGSSAKQRDYHSTHMRSTLLIVPIVCALLAPLNGEVIESTAAGFAVRNTTLIEAPPARVYAALTETVGGWWDPAHTFSHDARNLSL